VKTDRREQLTCIDHTVSQEKFHLEWDAKYEMYITTPRPDDKDLGRYYESASYISHTDAKESFIDKLYQMVKNYTIKQKVQLIGSFTTSDISILDIGCGTGDFLVACKNRGWEVEGIEPNEKARHLASNKLQLLNNPKSDKVHHDILELVKNKRKYDVISMWHVLEHVTNLSEYIEYLKSLLKPNGILLIAVPNFNSFDADYYKEHWAAYDVPRHLWHFSKKSIDLLFKKTNLQVIKTIPMKFDSYYVSLLSEKYKTGNSNFLRALYIGSLSNLKAIWSKEYSSLIYVLKHTNN
jgi:2-polyprenyl-3-methyl-5-hydroxy-6-metoxy-1,4-benzoquinol methylase